MGETWKCLAIQARETLECYKQSSVGNHEDRISTEVQNINRNADSKNCSHEASNGNENSVGELDKGS